MENERLKRGRVAEDGDPLDIGLWAMLKQHDTLTLAEAAKRVLGNRVGGITDPSEIRMMIYMKLRGSRRAMERYMGIPSGPSIQKLDPRLPAPGRDVLLSMLYNASVPAALDLIRSVPFLSRHEYDNKNEVWQKIFARNFPEYLEVMNTGDPDMHRNVAMWVHWAQQLTMKTIVRNSRAGTHMSILDYENFMIGGKRVHIRAFAFAFGFYKGRLLAGDATIHEPNYGTFDEFLTTVRNQAMHAWCFRGGVYGAYTDERMAIAYEEMRHAASERMPSLASSPNLYLFSRPPKDDDERIFLGNEVACSSCGIGQATQWFECSDCKARVCASGECERTHMREFH